MASRLEAATKQYGATILMSEEFVRMLSPGVRWVHRRAALWGSCPALSCLPIILDWEGKGHMAARAQRSLRLGEDAIQMKPQL